MALARTAPALRGGAVIGIGRLGRGPGGLGAGPGLALLALLALLGCETGPDLRYHGRERVAVGDYRVLSLHSDAHDDYAFARDRSQLDALAILPFHGKPCHIGETAGYAVVQRESGLRVAVLDADADANLRVFDEHCKQQFEVIPHVIDLAFFSDRLLVTTSERQLFAVDIWEGRIWTVSKGFSHLGSFVLSRDVTTSAIWLLEGDTLVLRNLVGAELDYTGQHVQEISVARDQQSMIYSDDKGLFTLDGKQVRRIGDPACKLRYERWVLSQTTTMNVAMALSPCDLRRLTLIEPDGTATVVADDVVSFFPRHFITADRRVENWTVYTQVDESAAEHTFMAAPEGEPFEVEVPISARSTLFPVQLVNGVARVWLMTTAEEEPRFGLFTPADGFEELARQTHIVALSPAGFVVQHDYTKATGGTVSRVDLDGRLHALAHGVPDQGLWQWGRAELDTGIMVADAVLHDIEGDAAVGTLSTIGANARLHEIARGVPAWSPDAYVTLVRGAQLVAAARDVVVLTYLHDFDPDTKTGTLSLVSPDGERIAIDDHVASYVASDAAGREGVLYATSGDGPHEVWFVRQ